MEIKITYFVVFLQRKQQKSIFPGMPFMEHTILMVFAAQFALAKALLPGAVSLSGLLLRFLEPYRNGWLLPSRSNSREAGPMSAGFKGWFRNFEFAPKNELNGIGFCSRFEHISEAVVSSLVE